MGARWWLKRAGGSLETGKPRGLGEQQQRKLCGAVGGVVGDVTHAVKHNDESSCGRCGRGCGRGVWSTWGSQFVPLAPRFGVWCLVFVCFVCLAALAGGWSVVAVAAVVAECAGGRCWRKSSYKPTAHPHAHRPTASDPARPRSSPHSPPPSPPRVLASRLPVPSASMTVLNHIQQPCRVHPPRLPVRPPVSGSDYSRATWVTGHHHTAYPRSNPIHPGHTGQQIQIHPHISIFLRSPVSHASPRPISRISRISAKCPQLSAAACVLSVVVFF